MGNLLRRMWRYLSAAMGGKFEEAADPRIQIEQAIADAQSRHAQLRQTAANVIANQKKAEMELERAMQELEKLTASTQQAVIMASEAERAGDTQRMTELTGTAEAFANRLISKEEQVETLKQMVLQATRASDQAKAAVAQNSAQLQRQLGERQKLLSQLDQAKLGEQMTAAMEQMNAHVGEDVPSLEEVRRKIEDRLARAQGVGELQADSVEGRMLEVERAAASSQASARLSEIRSRLGLPATTGDATAPSAEAAPATQPGTAAPAAPPESSPPRSTPPPRSSPEA